MKRKRSGKRILAIAAAWVGIVGMVGAGSGWIAYRMGLGPFAPLQADMTIDATARTATLNGAIAAIERYYVLPDQAAAMARDLRASMVHGDFDTITSAQILADTLTERLHQASGDEHLAVRYFQAPIAELPPGEDLTPEEKAEEASDQKRLNYGFRSVSRLNSNIGYIDLHAFGRPGPTAAKIAGAMALLSDTRALIIDLRECAGGDPETVMLLASYFFDSPTHLNDIYWRDENRLESRWTQARVEGTRYGTARKVYVLTSGETFSAAEDFAYALQANGRATIVGTPTQGGGAHPGQPRRINDHFMIFVPTGRTINPLTHTNWQAKGVLPNIPTSEARALDVAQIEVLKTVVASDPDPRVQQAAKQRIAELD